jgi:hypothetical protein
MRSDGQEYQLGINRLPFLVGQIQQEGIVNFYSINAL